MAQSNTPFRGGNVVHRIELPRRRRPAGGARGEPLRPADPQTPPGVSPDSPGPTPVWDGRAPDPAPQEPAGQGARKVVNVEFEVLEGSTAPHAQLTLAQERQAELELALERETNAQETLRHAHREEVEFLERRLNKLRGMLEVQEVDLRRAVSEGQIDAGWSSCYRDVQGLDMHAPGAELKREMLSQIFEANRELQTRIASLGA